jgi:hypothetical protein
MVLYKEPKLARVQRANVGKVRVLENTKPRQRLLPNGNVLVCHREFITKIPGSVAFSLTSSPLNPGLPVQFQWLYQMANSFESYQFRKLRFIFQNSKAGTFSGEVIMGIDYDPSDPSPFNEAELQTYWGCKTGQICAPLVLDADVRALNKVPIKFVRVGDLSPNQDIKLYDAGNFFLAISDCTDVSTVGRLFVEYEVELSTPGKTQAAILSGQNVVTAPAQGGPLGTGFGTQDGNLKLNWVSNTSFTVPVPGKYIILITATGTGITANIALGKANFNDVIITAGGSNVFTATQSSIAYIVNIQNSDDFFQVGSTTTTLTALNLRVMPYTTGAF